MTAAGRKLKIQTIPGLSLTVLAEGLKCLVRSLYPAYQHEKMVITHLNGEAVGETEAAQVLTGIGFEKGYREMTLWPSQRRR